MGWVHEVPEDGLYDHEGYCVAVLGDGSEPAPLQVPVLNGEPGATTPNSAWWLYDGSSPDRPQAVAVRAGCACGWRSTEMFPIDRDDQEATEGFEYNDGPFAAWERGHIVQLLGTTVPQEVSELIGRVSVMIADLTKSRPLAAVAAADAMESVGRSRLQTAVAAARPGSSWEAIGKALGTSRQAAHQRFAKSTGGS